MNITFIMSGLTTVPIGGFKIAYEYANRFAERGHGVTIVHPVDVDNSHSQLWKFHIKTRKSIGSLIRGAWFQFHSSVAFLITPSLEERHIPDADIVIACCWVPANWVSGYSSKKGVKFYFIQAWLEGSPQVDKAWRLNLNKIVISQWLKAKAEEFGETAQVVPNAIDTEMFTLSNPIEQRDPFALGMLYHEAAFKGFADGFQAVVFAKRRHPNISLKLFGVFRRPANLPVWVEYTRNPSPEKLVRIYNNVSIFVNSSLTEAWGLPPFEAMACGCAVAATNNGGINEYAEHDKSALISPIQDPGLLADNIVRLVENRNIRLMLARNGNNRVRQFTWEKSVALFERILTRQSTSREREGNLNSAGSTGNIL